MASFHCLAAFLVFIVIGGLPGEAKDDAVLICSERGLSFRMDNGMYWSSKSDGIKGQEARDYTCMFQVCMLGNGKVEITNYKNEYLSLASDYRNSIKTVKSRNPPFTEFNLHYVGDKVEFRASNKLLLSRIYYLGLEVHTLEAQKEETDHFTPFQLVTC